MNEDKTALEKPAFAPVGEMLEPLEPVVPDQPRRRSALAPIAELARLREAVTALADQLDDEARNPQQWIHVIEVKVKEDAARRLRSLLPQEGPDKKGAAR